MSAAAGTAAQSLRQHHASHSCAYLQCNSSSDADIVPAVGNSLLQLSRVTVLIRSARSVEMQSAHHTHATSQHHTYPKTSPVHAPTQQASTTYAVILPRLYWLVRPPGPVTSTPPAIADKLAVFTGRKGCLRSARLISVVSELL